MMKKILALIISLTMFFCFFTTANATDVKAEESTEITQEAIIAPDENDEELQKILSAVTQVATYIYNFATQPEEPAVDLETVIKIVTFAIYIIYGIVQQYASSNN